MQAKDRQKMCTHCDGRIPFDAHVCPYCATEQTAAPVSIGGNNPSLQDSLTALYSPPWPGKSAGPMHPSAGKNDAPYLISGVGKPQPLKEPMTERKFNPATVSPGTPTIPMSASEDYHADEGRSSFWPILLLSLGANLLLLGLLQLFFSDNGWLRLEWDSSYWFAFCLAALPLFFFGFKKVNALKN